MAKKSLYTKELSLLVSKDARPLITGRFHVITGTAKAWSVVPEGRVRASKTFSTQQAAVSYAKKSAAKLTGEVFVHSRTGQIRDTFSYAKK